ncbi:acyl-CoA thioester hydrolase [Humitalea rosea]|uniref:Acyl-CoA thioester hydrolase n=1 Tax=Humitalea rosea TaxID=990373 RepID=A0A2W7JAE3_9PROT|nr:thioesterase family protein [Humitalea rosea]PZW49105.1 acyl-CoA thioester hydrolase [Humitalea rosea]
MRLTARVLPEWVDHYGHMNLAYYLLAFDRATDTLWPTIGLGAGLRAQGLGTFAAETWVGYQREVTEGMELAFSSEVLGFDDKRLLIRHLMFHAEEGWLAAENEVLFLCVDLVARKVGRWPEATLAAFALAPQGAPAKRLALKRAG